MNPATIARVLSEIAQTASETLELQTVFDRVAGSVRELIPFEHMGVVRILDGERAVLHATTVPCAGEHGKCSGPVPLETWSPRVRPQAAPGRRIDDALTELDPSFPRDAELLQNGVASAVWEPFRPGSVVQGGVWLCSTRPNAFTDEHQEMLRPIAALLGSAVEHWRMWDVERRRAQRLAELEVLLGNLEPTLDVREMFQRVAEVVQPVLPHHLFVLTEVDHEAQGFRIVAYHGESDSPAPDGLVPMTAEEKERSSLLESEIVGDLSAMPVRTPRDRALHETGMRSWLRAPVVLSGRLQGSVGFFHREPNFYSEEDVDVARRLADRIALVLSHHRLAEQMRIASEARESAERLAATVETLTRELELRERSRVVGVSPSWKHVLLQSGRVTASDTTVLVTGESGTGKEIVARLIHQGSPRAGKPFAAINCAALPEQLLESELFGHERGAFTGATATKVGRLEQAAGGTLFLDEIGEMSPLVQAKFLRVLQEREFQRLGGVRTLRTDVRVIAATNRDLAIAMQRGEFREDLFYRLNVFGIEIPPLRERREDILPLVHVFLEELGRSMGRPAGGISRDAREWLLSYSWPGNVRELRNAIERAILLCDGGLITREHLPAALARPATASANGDNGSGNGRPALPAEGIDLEALDRKYVEEALRQAGGNRAKAARLLGLSRAQLYSRLDKYQLR